MRGETDTERDETQAAKRRPPAGVRVPDPYEAEQAIGGEG
jgi:hypothetical protein